MLIDTTKCATGCTDCVTACNTENGLAAPAATAGTAAQWIRKVEIKEVKTGRQASVPVMCQHCAEPPCVDVCPTGASVQARRRHRAGRPPHLHRLPLLHDGLPLQGALLRARGTVTDQKPDVPRGKGCVESCTLCVHRIDRGDKTTACAEACAKAGHGAIVFGDLNDPGSEIAAACARSRPRSCAPT
jgi:tetrathionate reductase subunit B